MADRDEKTLQLDFARGVGLQRTDAHARHAAVVAQHFVHRVVPDQLDLAGLGLGEEFVLQDLLGAQLVAAMHQVDLAGDVGQVERFFDGGVAAADHRHVLVAEEETVAGGAGRHALAHELLFGLDAEILGAGAGGDDQRIAGVFAAVALEAERAARQIGRVDMVEDDLGLEALGMRLHARHQVRTHQAVGIARPVVDLGRRHQLAALLQAGDQHRLEVGAGGIDGGGVAGRAGTEDQQLAVLRGAHGDRRSGRRQRRRMGGEATRIKVLTLAGHLC